MRRLAQRDGDHRGCASAAGEKHDACCRVHGGGHCSKRGHALHPHNVSVFVDDSKASAADHERLHTNKQNAAREHLSKAKPARPTGHAPHTLWPLQLFTGYIRISLIANAPLDGTAAASAAPCAPACESARVLQFGIKNESRNTQTSFSMSDSVVNIPNETLTTPVG